MAKSFLAMAAQGDLLIAKVNSIPESFVRIPPNESNHIVLAHSETGHNHVMDAEFIEAYGDPAVQEVDLYKMFLLVKEPTEIQHLRDFDTHEAIQVDPGMYQIRRQREYVPEGFRRAAD